MVVPSLAILHLTIGHMHTHVQMLQELWVGLLLSASRSYYEYETKLSKPLTHLPSRMHWDPRNYYRIYWRTTVHVAF